VDQFKSTFPSAPQDLIELAAEVSDLEIETEFGQYLRIWGAKGSVDMDAGYQISRYIPGAIPIGDDGGGRVIFVADGLEGRGLYHVGFGNLCLADAVWIAPTVSAFLCDAVGIDSF
jgi:hypothetical protein